VPRATVIDGLLGDLTGRCCRRSPARGPRHATIAMLGHRAAGVRSADPRRSVSGPGQALCRTLFKIGMKEVGLHQRTRPILRPARFPGLGLPGRQATALLRTGGAERSDRRRGHAWAPMWARANPLTVTSRAGKRLAGRRLSTVLIPAGANAVRRRANVARSADRGVGAGIRAIDRGGPQAW